METILIVKRDIKRLSPDELQRMLGNYSKWMRKYTQMGKYLGGSPFEPNSFLIKNLDNRKSKQEFIEMKDSMTGYIHLKTDNFNEALQITDECPLLKHNDIIMKIILDV